MDIKPTPERLTPAQFFDLGLDGATMTAAQLATRVAYSTIHRARCGGPISVETAKALAEWSRSLTSAQERGVCIDAALAVGITDGQAA
jgi:hypothetical protein